MKKQNCTDNKTVQDDFDKYIREWIKYLGLEHWEITITQLHMKEYYQKEGNESYNTLGRCHVMWPYMRAEVVINLDALSDCSSDEMVKKYAIHELLHIVVNEMRDDDEENIDHEERVVTMLTSAFARVQEGTNEK